ncbi:MAG TPA: TIGR01777 family oxidoreductase [Phnomibacter sp.]|nr:TIGR01777 family oxidoreductase [Phnomibacter sp.]
MQSASTILITGGTGLVGTRLSEMLIQQGFRVIVLTRDPSKQIATHPHLQFAKWDVAAGYIDPAVWAQADVVVHLAGAGVLAKPWTHAYKKELVDSRVQSGKLLLHALQTEAHHINTVISASGIGYYGADTGTQPFEETAEADTGFIGDLCTQWEAAVQPVLQQGIRLVIARLGIVIAREGGAMLKFKKSLKFRVAAVLGNGQQIISWIHIDDLCRFFIQAIADAQLQGVYNAVAPAPVSNQVLTLAIAQRQFGKGFITIHLPPFALKLLLGERSAEVLKSTTVSAEKLLQYGFQFQYPTIDTALAVL